MTYIEAPDEHSATAAEKSLDRDESSDFSLVEAVAERSAKAGGVVGQPAADDADDRHR